MLGYVAATAVMGWVLASTAFALVFLWLSGHRKPWTLIAVAVVAPQVLAYVFVKVVYIALPTGMGVFDTMTVALYECSASTDRAGPAAGRPTTSPPRPRSHSMETLSGVLDAFTSFDASSGLILVLGVVTGLLVGVLPGLTFVMGVLLLLPFTYGMETDSSIALMLAVYVAGTYGGAITSILLHIPGEPNNVPLLWDGYTMTRQGRAAEALGLGGRRGARRRSGLVGGARVRLRADFAARPQPRPARVLPDRPDRPDQRAGADRRLVRRSLMALLIGMLMATVGVDDVYGSVRFDFGSGLLRDGVDYLPVMVGIYALTHVLVRFGERFVAEAGEQPSKVRTVVPGLRASGASAGSLTRGIALGSLSASYRAPVRRSRRSSPTASRSRSAGTGTGRQGHPERRHRPAGGIHRNRRGRFIPMLVLGIPGSAATAVILGALLIHNVQPGPQIFQPARAHLHDHRGAARQRGADVRLGVLAAKPMMRMLNVPEPYVAVIIVLFAYIGAFAIRNTL